MIKNRLVDQICCLGQNVDTLESIESIYSSTVVLDLRAENDNCITHIVINQEMVQKLSENLKKWTEGDNNENS